MLRQTTFRSTQAWIPVLRDYFELTKPEVNLLILIATSAGYILGSKLPVNFLGLLQTLIGTLLVASGTATLNQYLERAYDAKMRRTANRPLPAGRLSPRRAFWFGILLSIAGGLELITVNALAAALAIATLLAYLFLYTPLKRKTALCTLIGAVPGAMPVLIGWAGASGRLNSDAGLLFAVLFLWQFPHFLAIALMYREDYERAGYRMLPAFDRAGSFTRCEILGTAFLLGAVTIVGISLGTHGGLALAGVICLGVFLLYHSVRLLQSGSTAAAGRLLHASVIYLPVLFAVMITARLHS